MNVTYLAPSEFEEFRPYKKHKPWKQSAFVRVLEYMMRILTVVFLILLAIVLIIEFNRGLAHTESLKETVVGGAKICFGPYFVWAIVRSFIGDKMNVKLQQKHNIK